MEHTIGGRGAARLWENRNFALSYYNILMSELTSLLELAVRAAIRAGEAIMEVYNDPAQDWQVERKADNSPLTLADRRAHGVIAPMLAETNIPLLSEEGSHAPYAERKGWQRLWIVDPLDGTKEFIKRNGEFTVNIALVENGSPVLGVIYVPVSRRLYRGVVGEGAAVCECVPTDFSDSTALSDLAWQTLPQSKDARQQLVVVASRSHLSAETEAFIDGLRSRFGEVDLRSAGSSLKICLVAEGAADVYPRLAPTMEWDTAAGHAIVLAAGGEMTDAESGEAVRYNKENLLNPFFIVRAADFPKN